MNEIQLPNLEQPNNGQVNEEGMRVILQSQEWFQHQVDLVDFLVEKSKVTKKIEILEDGIKLR